MQTYSHVLMAALAQNKLKKRGVSVHTKAILLGSFMPDVPLTLLTIGFFIYHRWLFPPPGNEFLFGPQYDNLYFYDPLWISSHSLFHSPLMIAWWLMLGYVGLRHQKKWGRILFWFAIGCAAHSLVDILTHYDDGPLLFYPFDWTTRFSSPVSYWDPAHYGQWFAPVEHGLGLGIIIYFVAQSRWGQWGRTKVANLFRSQQIAGKINQG